MSDRPLYAPPPPMPGYIRALRVLAYICIGYPIGVVLTWVVALWAYILLGPVMSSDQAGAMVAGGVVTGVILGFAGLWLAFDLIPELTKEWKEGDR